MQVSIGMPVYNSEKYLHFAIDSLLQQDYEDFELIISDNASTDTTPQICQEYARTDRRIRYFRQPENRGAVNNFNFVLHQAEGKYFTWAAGDDIWDSRFIAALASCLDNHPEVALAFCYHDRIDENNQLRFSVPQTKELQGSSHFDDLRRYLLQPEIQGKATLIYGLMPRQILLTAGGFDLITGEWGADMQAVFRLLTFGRLHIHPEVLYHKRLVSSIQLPDRSRYLRDIRHLLAKAGRFFYTYNAYLCGYQHIVIQSSLPIHQKLTLLALCEYRRIRPPL